jgi:hypothetical protein
MFQKQTINDRQQRKTKLRTSKCHVQKLQVIIKLPYNISIDISD